MRNNKAVLYTNVLVFQIMPGVIHRIPDTNDALVKSVALRIHRKRKVSFSERRLISGYRTLLWFVSKLTGFLARWKSTKWGRGPRNGKEAKRRRKTTSTWAADKIVSSRQRRTRITTGLVLQGVEWIEQNWWNLILGKIRNTKNGKTSAFQWAQACLSKRRKRKGAV